MKNTVAVRISDLVVYGTLLVLTQLLVSQWTVHAAGNRDVLDYVSFAGTVVGMILAVLAIVYSYLANASQKADAEALRAQIDLLNQTINRADIAGRQFEAGLTRLDDIASSIGTVSKLTEESLAVTKNIHDRIPVIEQKALSAAVAQKAEVSPASKTAEDGRLSAVDLVKKATADQLISYATVAIEIADNDGTDEMRQNLLKTGLKKKEVNASDYPFRIGEQYAYYLIFALDFRLDEDSKALALFDRAIIQALSTMKPNRSALYTPEAYAEKAASITAWLQNKPKKPGQASF